MAMRNPIISRKEFDQAITSTSRQRLGTIYSVGMLYVYRTCIAHTNASPLVFRTQK